MTAYPKVKAYRAGHSYRGRDTSVMEITQPTGSELISVVRLNLVSKAGFSFLMAHLDYLRDGEWDLERIDEAGGPQDAVALTTSRVRPVRPGRPTARARATTTAAGK